MVGTLVTLWLSPLYYRVHFSVARLNPTRSRYRFRYSLLNHPLFDNVSVLMSLAGHFHKIYLNTTLINQETAGEEEGVAYFFRQDTTSAFS